MDKRDWCRVRRGHQRSRYRQGRDGGIISVSNPFFTSLSLLQTINAKGQPHSAELWNEVLAINLSGTFHLTRLASKQLIHVPREDGPDGERGVIIMISSSVAVRLFSLFRLPDLID